MNLPFPDMHTAQQEAAQNGDAAFLVTRNRRVYFPRYRLVDTAAFPYEGQLNTYYLYARE